MGFHNKRDFNLVPSYPFSMLFVLNKANIFLYVVQCSFFNRLKNKTYFFHT